ncbi:MAG: nucleotidyltransferase domain-containing protein [Nocardioidaceae bacterium]|nr:nucleotidyltransferase domain-containing protein [Nocardioidaceae bacterium]
MEEADTEVLIAAMCATLEESGALFGYLHGSRAAGSHRADSDIDVAAYSGADPPQAYDVLLPPGVDLLVLDQAPLELAGGMAVTGTLLFEQDPVARVRRESTTRKIYFDELPRIRRAHDEFAARVRGG